MRHLGNKKNRSKSRNQSHHTKIRALQHFGVRITKDDIIKMAEIYRHDDRTKILYKQSNRRIKAIITYKGEAYPVIYDKERHQLATILSPDYLNRSEREIYDKYRERLLRESK